MVEKYGNIKKEYGGFLPIGIKQYEYYNSTDTLNVSRYNSGRSAIYMAIRSMRLKKVWLPVYLCQSVSDFLKSMDIQVRYYNIDNNFHPLNASQDEDEALVWTNYYGICKPSDAEYIQHKYRNVIIDNTQAFFSNPLNGCYNVYSPRKFVGVSDGAYLVSDIQIDDSITFEESDTIATFSFLEESLTMGTNAVYDKNLDNEKRIENEGLRSMSTLTRVILGGIDYDQAKVRRQENFRYLADRLDRYNLLDFDVSNNFPMVYPLLCKEDGIRRYLLDNHIYISQWWKWVLRLDAANEYEKILSKYLIPLPVDQRYYISDMNIICNIIDNYLK